MVCSCPKVAIMKHFTARTYNKKRDNFLSIKSDFKKIEDCIHKPLYDKMPDKLNRDKTTHVHSQSVAAIP